MNILDFENQNGGKTDGLILASGPSLNDFSEEKIREIAQDKTIIAIKQGFLKVPDIVDYHVINDNNYEQYDYINPLTVVISEIPANSCSSIIIERSHYTFLIKQNWDFQKSLSAKLNFDDWTINKEPKFRPWGPGIMYEVVFFLAHFIGLKNIYTIGWDLGPPGSTTREHSYSHQVINPAFPLNKDEAENEVRLTGAFFHWLKDKGVNLFVASANSYAHEDITRVTL